MKRSTTGIVMFFLMGLALKGISQERHAFTAAEAVEYAKKNRKLSPKENVESSCCYQISWGL